MDMFGKIVGSINFIDKQYHCYLNLFNHASIVSESSHSSAISQPRSTRDEGGAPV